MENPTETVPLHGGRPWPGSPPGTELLERGTTVGRYVVLDRIGSGGMGVVYAAWDPELERRIALKLLRPERLGSGPDRLRLLREAQALARLTHPNVVAVHDAGALGDRVFVAMELVEGRTLRQWLAESPRSRREILDVLLAAGRGLAAAHAAGLVHRDFKPENVLIGTDGRARVVDFGLARESGEEGGEEWGTVLGTPAYMAPEQLQGIAADVRSDQFSFCVSLYEALYGERPFPGKDPRETAEAVLRGEVRPEPAGTKVPGWLRQVLLRGLKARPEDRHPSMDALLRDLECDPEAGRRRWLVAAAAMLVAGGLFSSLGYFQARRAQLCGGVEEQVAAVWNAGRKQEIRAAFARTGVPFAGSAWEAVAADLDRYTRAWAGMRRAVCEATRVRGEQSEALLDRKMFCLDQKLREIGARADLLARADRQVVARFSDAVPDPGGLDACVDVQALMARVPPPPRGSAVRRRVEAVEQELSRAQALADAGREKEAIAVLSPSLPAVKATGYRPLEAEVLYHLGYWQERIGRSREAETLVTEALLAAQAGRYQEMVGEAASELSWIVGYQEARPAEGERWARLAQATADALQGDPALQARLLMRAASLSNLQGKNREAIATARRALDLVQSHLGPEHRFAAVLWSNLGVYYNQLGEYPRALDAGLRALEIRRRILPAGHPDFARSYNTLGNVYLNLHRPDLAEDSFRKAHAAFQDHYGSQYPDTAGTLVSLAIPLKERGRYEEALRLHREAREVFEKNFGRDHPAVSLTLTNSGEIYLLQKRYEEALATYRQSLEIDQKVLGPSHPDVAYSFQGIGLALGSLGRNREAAEAFSRAVALRESGEAGPGALAESRWSLAQVLWDAGEERSRALALARQAVEGFGAAGRDADRRDALTWLRERQGT